MKQDILALGGIITLCAVATAILYVSLGHTSELTCMVESSYLTEKGGVSTVTMTVKPLGEPVVLSSNPPHNPLIPDDILSKQKKIDPADYVVGAMFKCAVHTFRSDAFQTVTQLDNFANESQNANVRDRSYNLLVLISSIVILLIGAIYLVILIQVLRGVHIFSPLRLFYNKLEDDQVRPVQLASV
jgi:hypothetical protein